MLRTMTMLLRTVACVVLPLMASCATIRLGLNPDWPTLKQHVREQFPEVKTITVNELNAWLQTPSRRAPLLLDARGADEFAVSHLRNATSVPNREIALRFLSNRNNDQAIVVYCAVGYRSAALARDLMARGYTQAYNLEGSLFEWANSGLPVYRGDELVHKVHPYGGRWSRLLQRELWAKT